MLPPAPGGANWHPNTFAGKAGTTDPCRRPSILKVPFTPKREACEGAALYPQDAHSPGGQSHQRGSCPRWDGAQSCFPRPGARAPAPEFQPTCSSRPKSSCRPGRAVGHPVACARDRPPHSRQQQGMVTRHGGVRVLQFNLARRFIFESLYTRAVRKVPGHATVLVT